MTGLGLPPEPGARHAGSGTEFLPDQFPDKNPDGTSEIWSVEIVD